MRCLDLASVCKFKRSLVEHGLEFARHGVHHAGLLGLKALQDALAQQSGPVKARSVGIGAAACFGLSGRAAEFIGQIIDMDHLRGRHDREPVAEILQLPHVARKREAPDEVKRLGRQPLALGLQALGGVGEEMVGQRLHVFGASRSRMTFKR